MARVKVTCNGFKGGYDQVNGVRWMNVSQLDFLRASLTLGFQRFGDFARAGFRSWQHRLGLGLTGMAYLQNQDGDLCLSDGYQQLDGSEKSAMSYWQGMVFAKLAANEVLGIRWLAHVDRMRDQGLIQISGDTKERGDMVGRDVGGAWHVIEAKGRSNPFSTKMITQAKQQAALVKSINGSTPATTSACVSSVWTLPIEVLLDDPPSLGETKWDFKEEDFWSYYYGNLASYVREAPKLRRPRGFPDYTFASLGPAMGDLPLRLRFDPARPILGIGLPDMILEEPRNAPKLLERWKPDEEGYSTSDGVALVGFPTRWDKKFTFD